MVSNTSSSSKLRLWPGVVIVILQWMATFGTGLVSPGTPVQFFGMMAGPAVGLLLLMIWWIFASRAPRRDRVLGAVLSLTFLVVVFLFADRTAPTAIFIYGIPVLCAAFVLWAMLSQKRSAAFRSRSLVATLLVVCGVWLLLRMDGIYGDMGVELAWRWKATAEERLLASQDELVPQLAQQSADSTLDDGAENPDLIDESLDSEDPANSLAELPATVDDSADSTTTQTASASSSEGDEPLGASQSIADTSWSGFRGPDRNGIISAVDLHTDWTTSAPKELWKRPVGPAWSSFSVWKNYLYTQEQRGEDELVSAYDTESGEPIWQHRDPVRFWEAMAGAGPRATPTIHRGRVFALGATGLLNALDAVDGSLLWSRNVAEETGAKTPEWGFSSSPLIVDGLVVVHTGGPDGKGVVAYEADSGELRWSAPAGAMSYSSVHHTRLGGVDQLLILTGDGASSHSPVDGSVLWDYDYLLSGGARIVQPVIAPDDSILIGSGFGLGVRRLSVAAAADGWQLEERWTSTALKPYFNDFVLHGDHLYGFDGRILACLDLETGERVWKGGRYGNGQLVLLADQDLLFVLTDRGEIAVVSAKPTGFEELARMPAIEGKTWNHPVIADGVLYVRNAEEMAAFRLPGTTVTAGFSP